MWGKYFFWMSLVPIALYWGTTPPLPWKWILVTISAINSLANLWSFGVLHNLRQNPVLAPDWAAAVNMASFVATIVLIGIYAVMLIVT